jgi:hypothetical protein
MLSSSSSYYVYYLWIGGVEHVRLWGLLGIVDEWTPIIYAEL